MAAKVYLITGANRGIGFGLARAFAARGDTVIACSRRPRARWPRGVVWHRLDLTDDASITRLAGRLVEVEIDVLINNAGVSESIASRSRSGQPLGGIERRTLLTLFDTNAAGPLRLTQALLPNLARRSNPTIVNVSSDLASIGANAMGRWYAYRASKAALNMLTSCLAVELGPRGFRCVAVNPGWARTRMGGRQAPMSVQRSVKALVELIDRIGPRDAGRFLNYDGRRLPW